MSEMQKIIEYFDLGSEARARQRAISTNAAAQTSIPWLPQYIALLLGIVVQPFFQRYMETGVWELRGFWGWLAGSAILSAMAFPSVYKKTFDVEKPLFVQLCVIFTAGTGWQTLVSTALKTAGVAVGTDAGAAHVG
jgi:hypothetical protein